MFNILSKNSNFIFIDILTYSCILPMLLGIMSNKETVHTYPILQETSKILEGNSNFKFGKNRNIESINYFSIYRPI